MNMKREQTRSVYTCIASQVMLVIINLSYQFKCVKVLKQLKLSYFIFQLGFFNQPLKDVYIHTKITFYFYSCNFSNNCTKNNNYYLYN